MATLICLMAAMFTADEKPLSPRQQREREIKEIETRMAPIQRGLGEAKEDLTAAKNAPVGRLNATTLVKGGRHKWKSFKTAEKKAEVIAEYEKSIKDLESKLEPLQKELEAVKRRPIEQPKPKPPEKPEKHDG